eukprot:4426458-Pleurochrysis_carterae.AAC.2
MNWCFLLPPSQFCVSRRSGFLRRRHMPLEWQVRAGGGDSPADADSLRQAPNRAHGAPRHIQREQRNLPTSLRWAPHGRTLLISAVRLAAQTTLSAFDKEAAARMLNRCRAIFKLDYDAGLSALFSLQETRAMLEAFVLDRSEPERFDVRAALMLAATQTILSNR